GLNSAPIVARSRVRAPPVCRILDVVYDGAYSGLAGRDARRELRVGAAFSRQHLRQRHVQRARRVAKGGGRSPGGTTLAGHSRAADLHAKLQQNGGGGSVASAVLRRDA